MIGLQKKIFVTVGTSLANVPLIDGFPAKVLRTAYLAASMNRLVNLGSLGKFPIENQFDAKYPHYTGV